MSRKPTKAPTPAVVEQPLRDLFHQEQDANGGNVAASFIAILDELDRRNAASEARIESNAEAFRDQARWQNAVHDLLLALPGKVEGAADTTVRQWQGILLRQVEDKARLGAQDGSDGARSAAQALREAKDDYEHRKGWLRLLSTTVLPLAFGVAIVLGFLSPGILAKTLPASWGWTCSIVGAQHLEGNADQPTYCVIQKD